MQARSRLCSAGLLLLGLSVVDAQEVAKNAAPADRVQEMQNRWEAERAAALKQGFAERSLALSDELAQRGRQAAQKGSSSEALRLFRDARWQVPYYAPPPPGVARVFGVTHMRHSEEVCQVCFSPDARFLASASKDGTVKIWDMGNGRQAQIYRHKEFVHCVAWSPDGKLIASGGGRSERSGNGADFDIHLWNPQDGKLIRTLKGHTKRVNSVDFRRDSKTLVSAGDDGSIRIWDVTKGSQLQIVASSAVPINQAVFSPEPETAGDGQLIASANRNGQLQIWKPDTRPPGQKLLLNISANRNAYQVAFSPDGKSVFTCGSDYTARQYGAPDASGKSVVGTSVTLKSFDLSGGGPASEQTCLAVSPDGKTLVTGSKDSSIRLWDVHTAKVIRTLQGHSDEVGTLAFSKNGTQLASAGRDRSIRIWNLSTGDEHRTFRGHTGFVWSAVLSNDGKLIASGGADRKIVIREAQSGRELRTIPAHALAVTALAFSPDGSLLASAGGDKLVKLWDVNTGALVKQLPGHTLAVMAVAFGRDGKRIISGGADKIARLWDLDKKTTAQVFPDVHSPISAVALRPDGRQALVGCADGTLHVFDISAAPRETGFVSAHQSGIGGLDYGPDGVRAVTAGGDKLVRLWKVPDSGPPISLVEFKGHSGPVSSVSFSRDGRLVASAGADLMIKIWDARNGSELRSLRGHDDWVTSVAFGPDGRSVLSAAVDKTVRLWNLGDEDAIRLIGHSRDIKTLAVSADGKLLASGSADNTIKIWDTANGQELDTLAEHTDAVSAVVFDPLGARLLSGSGGKDKQIRFWDLKRRRVTQTIESGDVWLIRFSARGDKILTWCTAGGASTAEQYDAAGHPLHSVSDNRSTSCLAFTNDGELLATGNLQGDVSVWSIAKAERLWDDLPVFDKLKVQDVSFTADQKKLIAADDEGVIKIVDFAKREVIKSFRAHENGLFTIAVSPDGKRLLTVGGNKETEVWNELRLWNIDSGERIKDWTMPAPIRCVVYSPDGKKLYTANADTTIYQIDLP